MTTVLVTGATDGLGRVVAHDLAERGLDVLVHGRSAERADAVARKIGAAGVHLADFSVLDDVRALAEALPRVDVLVNNAGVFMNERKLSSDGFELTFAVNHLAPFLLTHLLLPQLRHSEEPRIVNVSSVAHARGVIDWDDLDMERGFGGYRAYAASKLMNVLFSFDLARRLREPFMAVNALHPGVIATKLLREGFGMSGGTLESGSATSVRVATDPALARTTGKYFSDQREAAASKSAHDRAAQERLYELSARLTGVEPLPAG
jgi:retinol dehydrogenase-14